MNYKRVIPRDFFNEAKLLKCWGQLWLKLENINSNNVRIDDDLEMCGFIVKQNPLTGYLYLKNVRLYIRNEFVEVFSYYNSRSKYPLYFILNEDVCPCLTEQGNLTKEFKEVLNEIPN